MAGIKSGGGRRPPEDRPYDGLEDAYGGRSRRRRGFDDDSMLGRGHPFGPETSGRRRDDMAPRRLVRGDDHDRGLPDRDFGRLANSREGRGMETGEPLEREVYPRGSMSRQGYGSRSRSQESRQHRGPDRDRMGRDFDDDLIR
jgi:hypothetical protein